MGAGRSSRWRRFKREVKAKEMCFDTVESEAQKKKRHEMYREIGWLLVAGIR